MKTSCSLVTTLQSSTARPRPRARGVASRASLVVGPAHARVTCLFLLRFVPSLARARAHGCDGGVPRAPAQSQGAELLCTGRLVFKPSSDSPRGRPCDGHTAHSTTTTTTTWRPHSTTGENEYTNDEEMMRAHSVNTTTTTTTTTTGAG